MCEALHTKLLDHYEITNITISNCVWMLLQIEIQFLYPSSNLPRDVGKGRNRTLDNWRQSIYRPERILLNQVAIRHSLVLVKRSCGDPDDLRIIHT